MVAEWFSELLRAILAHWVAGVLLPTGAAVMAYLRIKRPTWASPAFYALGTIAFLAVVMFTFTGHAVFSTPAVDASNAEENVQKWISKFGFATRAISLPDAAFAYQITLPDGNG